MSRKKPAAPKPEPEPPKGKAAATKACYLDALREEVRRAIAAAQAKAGAKP